MQLFILAESLMLEKLLELIQMKIIKNSQFIQYTNVRRYVVLYMG